MGLNLIILQQVSPSQGSSPAYLLIVIILFLILMKLRKTTFLLQLALMVCMRNWGPSETGTILCLRMVLKKGLKDEGLKIKSIDLVHEIEHRYHAIVETQDGNTYDMTVYANSSGAVQWTINN